MTLKKKNIALRVTLYTQFLFVVICSLPMDWLLPVFAVLLASGLSFVLKFIYWRFTRRTRARTVAVVVLGDVGRSPRMMYHAQSFAREGFQTYIIGYYDSQLPRSLRQLPLAYKIPLSPFPLAFLRLPFIVMAPFKVIWQIDSLLNSLTLKLPHIPEFIIVQVILMNLFILVTQCTLCQKESAKYTYFGCGTICSPSLRLQNHHRLA